MNTEGKKLHQSAEAKEARKELLANLTRLEASLDFYLQTVRQAIFCVIKDLGFSSLFMFGDILLGLKSTETTYRLLIEDSADFIYQFLGENFDNNQILKIAQETNKALRTHFEGLLTEAEAMLVYIKNMHTLMQKDTQGEA